ncbi:unnamed protein product [Allacma fusca]|uniref:limulus clotting factor C n=1 Tax=Allacma fusca TaxID=39272 RepID=A0A8J2KZ17_9HEXA|nr:unnamed protein product [Allacma fusca]
MNSLRNFAIIFATTYLFLNGNSVPVGNDLGSLQVIDTRAFDMQDMSQEDLRELSEKANSSSCTCGNRNEENRIVGGEAAGIGEFPWRCGMFFKQEDNSMKLFCGCSVISHSYILTAAHCTNAFPGRQIYVNAGDYDLTNKTEVENQVLKVKQVIQHENYSIYTHDTDLSLLELERPLNFSRTISPVCLPWKFTTQNFTNGTVTASGSGLTAEGGNVSPIVRKVDLPLIPHELCQEYYGVFRVSPNMICTYTPGKDTCQGDSGSSIDFKDEKTSQYYAVGITSWGSGCARDKKPGVYTRLANFLQWIESKAIGAEFSILIMKGIIISLSLFLSVLGSLRFSEGVGNESNTEESIGLKTGIQNRQRQRGPCDYSHTFTNVGEYIYLQSEKYPFDYPDNLRCSYALTSPRGTQVRLECPASDFNIQPSNNCVNDWFYWSVSGDQSPEDRIYVCGSQNVNIISNQQRLVMGFRSDSSNPVSNRAWRYKCKLTAVPRTDCFCGDSGADTRIVGGVEASIAEFPWRVALYTQSRGMFCAGTLISRNWVLTAAHCVVPIGSEVILVDVGDHDLSRTSEADNVIVPTDRRIVNSAYNNVTEDSDTALLHLKDPVRYSRFIQPLCLPWKYTFTNFQGAKATASGWGTQSFGGQLSAVLRKVELNVLNNPNCADAWSGSEQPITQNMICASAPGKDTCQGDSGGSLDYKELNSNRWYGIGIVSFGGACGEPDVLPAIYVQLVNFLGWIEQNTGETYCKI